MNKQEQNLFKLEIFFFFQEINTFAQQGYVKLIKKSTLLQMLFFLTFNSSKNTENSFYSIIFFFNFWSNKCSLDEHKNDLTNPTLLNRSVHALSFIS